MLRRRFMRDINIRFAALKRAVIALVFEEDAFGLAKRVPFTINARWEFRTDDAKVEAFKEWFNLQVEKGILSVDTNTGEPWAAKYVTSAYRQGIMRAYTDVRPDLGKESMGFMQGSRAQFLQSSFNQPERVSKVKMLATRTFEELKGMSAKMGADMNRVLADAMAKGLNPRQVARTLTREVDISRERALRIARTEIIHAHAEGQLDSMEDLGVEEVGAMVEWSTAGDGRVCQRCQGMQGKVFTLKEARGMLPLHPNCRCAWIPYLGKVVIKIAKRKPAKQRSR